MVGAASSRVLGSLPGTGISVSYGVSRITGRLLEYLDLTPACGALHGWTVYFPRWS